MIRALFWRAAVPIAIAVAPAAAADALPDAAVREAMAIAEVPGLALAVVRRDRPTEIRVYGRRDVERGLPVTPRTLFAAGSIAKSFTVLGLAMQADEGRIDWDAPVRRAVPDLILADDARAGAISLRDLVTHRTGMPRHDALWYLDAYDRDGLLARLRHLRPAAPLGALFAYNNLMVAAAGHVLARIEGAPWEAAIRRRLLMPLGMSRARLTLAGFRAAADRASPYFPAPGGRQRIPLRDTGAIAPAAALYADAPEMARYLRLLMSDGMHRGRRLLSVRTVRALRTARIETGRAARYPERGPTRYGMGLYLSSYRGRPLVYHPGVIDGFSAMLSFLPEDGLGVVVLSNLSGGNPVPEIVSYAVYDALLGLAPLPWTERLRARRAARAARAARRARAGAVRPPPASGPPPRGLAAYAGDYRHPAYGTIRVRAPEGPPPGEAALAGALHGVRFLLAYAGGDSWRVTETAWPLRAGLSFRFRFDGDGPARGLETPLADGPTYRLRAGDLYFARAAPPDGGARSAP